MEGDDLANTLEIGDNFAINAKFGNAKGVHFYIISCSKPIHVVNENFKCHWGTKFTRGETDVVGKYYKKWGNYYSTYVLLKDSHVVFLYSHLVRVTKILVVPKDYCVQGNDIVYELPDFVAFIIRSTLVALEFD
jgi:hypothetical protein